MMTALSEIEAFQAMFLFLREVYERTESDDLGSLLGAMSFLPDGNPADPATWSDWQMCVKKAKEGTVDIEMRLA